MENVQPRPQIFCNYCSKPARLCKGEEIHGAQFKDRDFWKCDACDAWTSTHPNSNYRPTGPLANPELRHARREAHSDFDKVIRRYIEEQSIDYDHARRKAYKWLAGKMLISREDCHIGKFDVEMCRRAIMLCMAAMAGRSDNGSAAS